ncbi:hypothetical protein J6590_106822 [Homalodisca vitripennis]|nr:hypothetical protein J6590_106822 [Homalodisca vitripennis]
MFFVNFTNSKTCTTDQRPIVNGDRHSRNKIATQKKGNRSRPPGKEIRSGSRSGPDPLTERLDKERALRA